MNIRNKLWILPILLIAVLLVSCSKSPQEKIVGKWNYVYTVTDHNEVYDKGKGIMTFDSEGKMIIDVDPDQNLKWELKGEEGPYKLNQYEDDQLELTWELIFISNDKMKMKYEEDNEITEFTLTRIK